MSELPEGWAIAKLADIANWGSGGTPSRLDSKAYEGSIPWIKTGELGPRYIFKTEESLSSHGLRTSSAKLFPAGSVAVAMYGATIGKTSILGIDASTNQACAVGTPIDACTSSLYLYFFIASQKLLFIEAGKGGAQPNISQGVLKEWLIPLPPLPEQTRIANKLDPLLARVDSARDRLDRVPGMLKRFRQAVLSAATSGVLTEGWRTERPHIPSEWPTTNLGSQIIRIEAGLSVQCDERPPEENEIGLVKISAVTWGTFDDDESKTLRSDQKPADYLKICPGDFLISRANTMELVGNCVIVNKVKRAVYLSDKVLRLVMPEKVKLWLLYVLRSEDGRRQIETLSSGNQLSMRNLSQSALKSIQLRMPHDEEIVEIVRQVEILFAYADRLEARLKTARKLSESLSPAILAKAFRGELVAQDPNDEPAAALLKRIRAGRK